MAGAITKHAAPFKTQVYIFYINDIHIYRVGYNIIATVIRDARSH